MVIEDTSIHIQGKKAAPEQGAAALLKFDLASPLDRFAAFVVDHLILLSPVLLLLTAPFERHFKEAMMLSNDIQVVWSSLHMGLMWLVILLVYHSVFSHLVGGTLGQLFMGLRVTRLWDSEPLGIWNSVLRSFCWILSALFFGLPLLAVFSDPYRRTWYDRMSDSVVITKRKHRSKKVPALFEISLVQGFMVAFLVFTFGLMGMSVMQSLKDYGRDAKILSLLEEDGVLCASVGDALAEWPLEDGEEASRVSVAMALYFAGRVDVSCLEAEFDPRALAVPDNDLAQLAKAIIYADHEELSQLYLQETCNKDEKGVACGIARATEDFIEGEDASIEDDLKVVREQAPVYAKIWALRFYVEADRFEEGERYLEGLSGVTSLAEALVPLKTKILWGQGRQEEAAGALEVAYQMLPPKELADLSSWVCYGELSQSCDNWDSVSCDSFQDVTKDYVSVLNDASRALTFLKKKECEASSPAEAVALLPRDLSPEVKPLADAIAQGNPQVFLNLMEDDQALESVRAEAAAHLLRLSDRLSDREAVQAYWDAMPSGRLWKNVGAALLDRALQHRDYELAENVANQVNDWTGGRDQRFLEKLVISEYYLGKVDLAKTLLKTYSEYHPLNWFRIKAEGVAGDAAALDSRRPASQMPGSVEHALDEFATIVRSLE